MQTQTDHERRVANVIRDRAEAQSRADRERWLADRLTGGPSPTLRNPDPPHRLVDRDGKLIAELTSSQADRFRKAILAVKVFDDSPES